MNKRAVNRIIRHDVYFKQLLNNLFPDFIALFFPQMLAYLDLSSVTPVDKELLGNLDREQTNLADLVMKAKFKHSEAFFLVHIETQAQHQPDFSRRLFQYFAKLYDKYGLPVYPIVLFSFDQPFKEQPACHEVQFPDLHVLKFNYRSIQLNRMCWKDYLGILNPVAAALMTRMKMSATERARVKLECLALLNKANRDHNTNKLVSRFIDIYLRLTPAEAKEYMQLRDKLEPEVKEAVMEIETSWEIKGRKQGLQEGLVLGLEQGREQGVRQGQEQGLRQGMAIMLEQQLSSRISNLPKESVDKIHKLSS